MRLLSFSVASIVVTAVLVSVGCNSLTGIDDYNVSANPTSVAPDAGAEAGPPAQECATNAECIAKLGDFSICRKQDHVCTKLLAPDCPQVLGEWQNDDAIILGSILPIVGTDKAGGIPQFNALKVALEDFQKGANGLPPAAGSTNRRPLAIVGCSEESDIEGDLDAPTRSAKHLVETVKVPAIVGASFSGDTQAVAQITIPAGVLLISPSATSVALTDLQDNGLVWRTSPSDVFQAQAFVKLMPQIETATRKRLALTTAAQKTKVLVLHKGDSYGGGLANALRTSLRFNALPALDNAASDFVVIDYGDPSVAPADYNGVLQQVFTKFPGATAPSIVLLLGTNEVVPELLEKLEAHAAWPSTERPTYLFPDGGLIPELWGAIKTNTDLRKRVFGTTPGTNNALFQTFKSRYISLIKDGTTGDVGGVPSSYDAVYLLAYAIAATSDRRVTGDSINFGLKRVVPVGTPSQPGITNINTAFGILSSGKNIDYDGASGPLDFDVEKGEAASDIQVWCIPTVDHTPNGTAGPGVNSGAFFDAKSSVISGPAIEPLDVAIKTVCDF